MASEMFCILLKGSIYTDWKILVCITRTQTKKHKTLGTLADINMLSMRYECCSQPM